ncbi:hypothetical protein HNP68_001022 [Borrelia yangtzensis]|uniref:Uncharacterized protein n=1 Tax=Borreliella yangtzensis TaxID=683292 RepID=A0ABR6PAV0_9SPIR|nr:hypothetical protein [Borreliella yangtzensis]
MDNKIFKLEPSFKEDSIIIVTTHILTKRYSFLLIYSSTLLKIAILLALHFLYRYFFV